MVYKKIMKLSYKKFYIWFVFFYFIFNIEGHTKNPPSSFADLADELMPSVVNISTTQTIKTQANPFPFQFPPGSPFGEMFKEFDKPTERKATSLGSGFIIKKDGTVITNNHVIANAEDIIVRVNNKEYQAKVVGADPYSDIAVLKIETSDTFKIVEFGNSDKSRVGDWVVAIGNPFGLGGTVTSGIISARNRDINLTRYDDFIQTDASINQGNSGGPLFNLDGDVIGINTAIISPSGASSGIGFAIPANYASTIIDQLIKFGETKRGWLGVRIQEVTKEIASVANLDEPRGAFIGGVSEGSPAEKGGMKSGDIVLEFDGQKIKTMRNLPKVVANTPPNKRVALKVWRDKKKRSFTVKLGELEKFNAAANEKSDDNKEIISDEIEIDDIGLRLLGLNKNTRSKYNISESVKGVVITAVKRDSFAAKAGLNVGNVISQIAQKEIQEPSQAKKIFDDFIKKDADSLLLQVFEGEFSRFLILKLK